MDSFKKGPFETPSGNVKKLFGTISCTPLQSPLAVLEEIVSDPWELLLGFLLTQTSLLKFVQAFKRKLLQEFHQDSSILLSGNVPRVPSGNSPRALSGNVHVYLLQILQLFLINIPQKFLLGNSHQEVPGIAYGNLSKIIFWNSPKASSENVGMLLKFLQRVGNLSWNPPRVLCWSSPWQFSQDSFLQNFLLGFHQEQDPEEILRLNSWIDD